MLTRVLAIDPQQPDPGALREAAEVLRTGGVVAFPTETVYGLGANAFDTAAVAGIFAAKGRPPHNPLIVHVPGEEGARSLVTDWPPEARMLAQRFWPGPLSLVLPRSALVPNLVTGGGPTVALRSPAHPVARGLLAAADLPLAAPSANRSNELSPTRAEHVLRGLQGCIDLVLDGGPTTAGIESTVLDLTSIPPRVLRAGPIAPSEIEAVIGPVGFAGEGPTSGGTPLPSPGMMERHYAPRTPLALTANGQQLVADALSRGERIGWLTWEDAAGSDAAKLVRLAMPRDSAAYAAQLYAALHILDAAQVARIIVDLPPDTEAWLAVRDRLRRAASP